STATSTAVVAMKTLLMGFNADGGPKVPVPRRPRRQNERVLITTLHLRPCPPPRTHHSPASSSNTTHTTHTSAHTPHTPHTHTPHTHTPHAHTTHTSAHVGFVH